MKPKIKKLWIGALKSGKYQQNTHSLNSWGKYCCLGVLCDLHRKRTKKLKWKDGYYDGQDGVLPSSVMKWAGLHRSNPTVHNDLKNGSYLIDKKPRLSDLNDSGASFKDIASMIENSL